MFKNSLLNPRPYKWALTRLSERIVLIYAIAAFAYAMYGAVTGSGLADFVLKLEMETIGVSFEFETMLITFGILMVLLCPIAWTAQKLAPKLFFVDPNQPGLPKPDLAERMYQPLTHVSWKTVSMVTSIPLVLGAILYSWYSYSAQRDNREKAYRIDLTSGVQAPPKNARFVELTGLVAHSHALVYKRAHSQPAVDDDYEIFAPVTGYGWTPAEPVLYVVRATSHAARSEKVKWPAAFRQPDAVQFSGQLSPSLPGFAESKVRSGGLKLAQSYRVIEYEKGRTPFDAAPMAAGICGLLAAGTFLITLMVKTSVALNRRKPGRQAA